MNPARLGLQYGSNVPIRAALALAAMFWSFGLVFVATNDGHQLYRLMADSHPLIWAIVFGIDSLLLWWRILDRKQRPHLGRLINALTSSMWLAITTATLIDSGFLAAAGGMTFFLMSLWAAARTDLTNSDRETV
jgi:peptidoglycan/LPS O-acetylase OafA/YrhL